MSQTVKPCVLMRVPREQEQTAIITAVNENLANTPTPFELGADIRFFWQPGRILNVRFLDGSLELQKRVATIATEWCMFANVSFDFNDQPDAEIRISFQYNGSWSYLGTQALNVPENRPTMNFGWLNANTQHQEFARVVLHEFGHALGCIHEHQNPGHEIPWNENAVYQFFMAPPNNWSKEQIQHNVLRKAETQYTLHSSFDPKSIMLYPIDEMLTIGNWSIPWQNDTLSEKDRSFIGTIYPFHE